MDEPLSNLDAKCELKHGARSSTSMPVPADVRVRDARPGRGDDAARRIVLLCGGQSTADRLAACALRRPRKPLYGNFHRLAFGQSVRFHGAPGTGSVDRRACPGSRLRHERLPRRFRLATTLSLCGRRLCGLLPGTTARRWLLTSTIVNRWAARRSFGAIPDTGGVGVCLRLPREQALQPQTLTRVIPDWKRLLVFGTDGRRIRFNAQVTPEASTTSKCGGRHEAHRGKGALARQPLHAVASRGLPAAFIHSSDVIATVVVSFTDWQLGGQGEVHFVGLKNYLDLWTSEEFRKSVRNTFFMTAVVVPTSFVLALALALAIRASGRLAQLWQTHLFSARNGLARGDGRGLAVDPASGGGVSSRSF